MSPALDMPLNRREAVTSLLAMLTLVMGLGGAIDEAEAEPEFSADSAENLPRTDYALDGIFVGHDGELEVNAEIRIEDAAIAIRQRGSTKVRTIYAQKPAAIAFVDTLATELLNGASTLEERRRDAYPVLPTPSLPPQTTAAWDIMGFGRGRDNVRCAGLVTSLIWGDGGAEIEFRPISGKGSKVEDPPFCSIALPRDVSRALLVSLSELADKSWERHLREQREKAWEVWCPECRGNLNETRTCKTCHGNYSRYLTAEEAEERYQRDRADYAAKVAALP